MTDTNLFGVTEDPFVTALQRYGQWPLTTWELDYGKAYQRLKGLVGDSGEKREGCFVATSAYDVPASVFHPVVAAQALRMFAPAAGLCFDPFAGGGTRAILSAKHGLAYLGVELRSEEADAVRRRVAEAGVEGSVHIETADARDCAQVASSSSADFLLTCPPYWNLERYQGGDDDLSMVRTFEQFMQGMRRVIAETHRVLKPGATSCWVVGLHRDQAGLIPIHHAITRAHLDLGFQMREEVVLVRKNPQALARVGNFEKGRQLLVRTHEYLLVFTKGGA